MKKPVIIIQVVAVIALLIGVIWFYSVLQEVDKPGFTKHFLESNEIFLSGEIEISAFESSVVPNGDGHVFCSVILSEEQSNIVGKLVKSRDTWDALPMPEDMRDELLDPYSFTEYPIYHTMRDVSQRVCGYYKFIQRSTVGLDEGEKYRSNNYDIILWDEEDKVIYFFQWKS